MLIFSAETITPFHLSDISATATTFGPDSLGIILSLARAPTHLVVASTIVFSLQCDADRLRESPTPAVCQT